MKKYEVTMELTALVTLEVLADSEDAAENEAGNILSMDENRISQIIKDRAAWSGNAVTDITWGIDESPQIYEDEDYEDLDEEEDE